MILVWLVVIPLLGGVLAWIASSSRPVAGRVISLVALLVDLVLASWLTASAGPWRVASFGEGFARQAAWDWFPRFGIRFQLGIDGLSLVMVFLTIVLGVLSVLASWREIEHRTGFFHLCLLWVLSGVIGVFLALDLFLFAFFWELMLVPMYFLIGVWGHENRIYAAVKFFIFTQATGLFMLISIIGLAVMGARATGQLSFAYQDLLGVPLAPTASMLLMLGFFVAFAVKLPAVPLHTWLPDAHTEAPTAGSLILAGLLLKTGAYGILRFAIPLFPEASQRFAPYAVALGVVGVVYGAIVAFSQHDLKRLVAYTSVSHLGFVLLGAYSDSPAAFRGVVLQMVCHGLSTGGLFVLVGALYERLHTRDLRSMGGFWTVAPRFGAVAMVLALASLGLPGLGNFIAEFMILVGSFRQHPAATTVATIGLVFATIYSLAIMQRAFFGPRREPAVPLLDLNRREGLTLGAMVALLVWLGLYPRPVLDVLTPASAARSGAGVAAEELGGASPLPAAAPVPGARQGDES